MRDGEWLLWDISIRVRLEKERENESNVEK